MVVRHNHKALDAVLQLLVLDQAVHHKLKHILNRPDLGPGRDHRAVDMVNGLGILQKDIQDRRPRRFRIDAQLINLGLQGCFCLRTQAGGDLINHTINLFFRNMC